MALLTYSDKYKLRESDMDLNDNIRVSALLDLFQSMAGKHATALGIGFEPTLARGLVWVLTKLKCDVISPMKFDETVTVVTNPRPVGLIDYTRDFFVYGEDGSLKAKATSQWVLLDYRTRKISKPVIAFDGEFAEGSAYESKRIEKVPPLSSAPVHSHVVTRSDIDHNGHTNNIKYADICFNAAELPNDYFKKFIINFSVETMLGDRIDVSAEQEGNAYLFCGRKGDAVSFTARIEY